MTIPVTTRTGLGSPLPTATMDTNLTNLARNSDESTQGNLRVATQVETDAGTSDTLAISPLKLAAALVTAEGDTITFTDHGSDEGTIDFLDGTIILKYGTTGSVGDTDSITVTYPTAFPTATLRVYVTMDSALQGATDAGIYSVDTFVPAGFDMHNGGSTPVSANTWHYLAIGN